MKKYGINIALLLILLVIIMPAVQLQFRPFREKPLNGAFRFAEKPSFSMEKWMSGEFQGAAEVFLKDHSGFRNFLVRLQNQLDFIFFRQANAEGAIVGKDKQLFEYDYIRSWLAKDYPGDSFIEKKLQRTKFVQEYLKKEKGIDLIVVFEPGKASFYPEFIPSRYTLEKNDPSTYDRYLAKAKEIGIGHIDLHAYFLQMKGTSEYPLFPRYGTHWSVYGMRYAADSLLRAIELRRGIRLTRYRVDSLKISDEPFDTDDDVLKTMNLLLPLKGEELAYPVFGFDTLDPGDKPMVLVVADSYYWNIFNSRIPKYLFANEAFWYFNTVVYPDNYFKPTYTNNLNFPQEIEKQQVIFLMITERFLHKFDWRFIDQLYALYTPDWLQDRVYEKINDIMQVAPWYAEMVEKAGQKNKSLEEILVTEGEYLYRKEDTCKFLIQYGPEFFRGIIADDPEWLAHVTVKAKERNISTDEMLETDALYIFKKDYPGLFDLNQGLAAVHQRLLSDLAAMDSLKTQADYFRWDLSSFVRLRAWQVYREEEIARTVHAIRSDSTWMADVTVKALKNGIPVEQMIRLDAEYIWEKRIKE